jgi:hypothetical protein
LSTGRLRVFQSLKPWFDEFRIYRRNEKGAVVKEGDHLMDATRYFCMSGFDVACLQKPPMTELQKKLLAGSGQSAMAA